MQSIPVTPYLSKCVRLEIRLKFIDFMGRLVVPFNPLKKKDEDAEEQARLKSFTDPKGGDSKGKG